MRRSLMKSLKIYQYVTTFASKQANKPVITLMPQFVDYLEGQLSSKLANLIVEQLSIHLSTIMKKSGFTRIN